MRVTRYPTFVSISRRKADPCSSSIDDLIDTDEPLTDYYAICITQSQIRVTEGIVGFSEFFETISDEEFFIELPRYSLQINQISILHEMKRKQIAIFSNCMQKNTLKNQSTHPRIQKTAPKTNPKQSNQTNYYSVLCGRI